MSTNSGASEREELLGILADKERRHHLASVTTKRTLAEQIREIRLARDWTQAELAHATGKVQETISQLENPDYGSYTLKTLQRLAEAFDVTLTVRFDPFSELVDRITHMVPEDLTVPDYEHDEGLSLVSVRMETTQITNAYAHLHTGTVGVGMLSTTSTPASRIRLVAADPATRGWNARTTAPLDYLLAQTGD